MSHAMGIEIWIYYTNEPHQEQQEIDDVLQEVFWKHTKYNRDLLGKRYPAVKGSNQQIRKRSIALTYSTVGLGCDFWGSTKRMSQVSTKVVKPIWRKTNSGSRSWTWYANRSICTFEISRWG